MCSFCTPRAYIPAASRRASASARQSPPPAPSVPAPRRLLYCFVTLPRNRSSARPSQSTTPASGRAPASRSLWWFRAALCAIALLAYGDSFGRGFALDPAELVLKDPRVRAVTAENLGLILHNDYLWLLYPSGLYRPVTTASFLFNYAVLGNGESATGYHWVNFLLHVGNVWLVFALARRLFQRTGPAFVAAALWAAHPIGTECVTNIGGRADLLAAMAVLGGLLLYIRSTEFQGWRLQLTAVALFAVAMVGVFSKESAAVLVGLMLLWDIGGARAIPDRGVSGRMPAYGAAVASLVVLWWVRHLVFRTLPWPNPPFVDNPLIGAGFWSARLTAIKVIGMDLWLLVCPLELSSDRSYHQIPIAGWSDVAAWLALAIMAGILAVAIAGRPRDRVIFWAAGFFGITLLPTGNLLFPIGSIMAERFLYLPSVGFAVVMASLAYRIPQQRWRNALVAVVLVVLSVRTYARNLAWEDDLTLASTDVETTPRSFKLHTLLAQELAKRDPQGNIDRAIRELERAFEILRPLPDSEMPQQNLIRLGDAYLVKGNLAGGPATPEGRAWYDKALPVLEHAKEISRLNEKSYDELQRAHGKPLGERFASQDLYYDLGVAYGSLGRYTAALETLRYGRGINPGRPDFYVALSAAYTGLLQPEEAATALLESVQVDGEKPETLASLRQLYARIPDGACAIEATGGMLKLNLDCPRLRAHLCLAQADLTRAFIEARQPARAQEAKESAIHRYGCPAATFESAVKP